MHQHTKILLNFYKKLCYCRGTARHTCQYKFCNYKTSHLKTRVPGLSCSIICVILRLAVLIQYRSVIDTHRQTDGGTDTATACTAVSIESHCKNRPHCTAHQVQLPGNERRLIANRQAYREMSVFTTYLNDNAQTPLNRFVVYMLYKHVCNRHGDKSNRWSLCLSLSQLECRPSEV